MSPFRLFAPPNAIVVPFMSHEVVDRALRLPADAKFEGAYYRAVLEAAGGSALVNLPSTNDGVRRPRRQPPRQASQRAVERLRDDIGEVPDVERLMGPKLRSLIESPDASDVLARNPGARAILQGLATFAAWWRAHHGTLQ
jgi:hypothetical protein